MKTAHLIDPLGIDIRHSLLTWTCEGGVKQRAYQITACVDGAEVWNIGKVQSGEVKAIYTGPDESRNRVCWQIRLWDENDTDSESNEAWFEYALLEKMDFQAKWINPETVPLSPPV